MIRLPYKKVSALQLCEVQFNFIRIKLDYQNSNSSIEKSSCGQDIFILYRLKSKNNKKLIT